MILRVKKGPVLLWTVATVVQRTNERVAGITGLNPVTQADYYQLAAFEVKVVAMTNLVLNEVRIFGALSDTNAFPAPGVAGNVSNLWDHIAGGSPALAANQGVCALAVLPGPGNSAGLAWAPFVPPTLLFEYTTGIPGATPNLQFEVRGFFSGSPFYAVD